MKLWLQSIDRNEVTYWLGLGMLFAGVALRVSTATALIVAGAIVLVTSVASSFFVTWLSAEKK
jgi:hypothetical protein